MKLKGKKVLITGATSGLGFSLAKLLVKKGSNVYGTGRSEKTVKAATEKNKDSNFQCFVCDVRKAGEIEKLKKAVGEVDILVNNAGIWLEGNLEDNPPEKIGELLDTNLKGAILVTRAFLPGMLKKTEAMMVNISSSAGVEAKPYAPVYVASKWGVTGFTKSMQLILGNTPVKVVGFYPGGMKTEMYNKAGTPKEDKDWMDTEKVAEIVVSILEQDKSMVTDHVVLNRGK